MFTMHRNLVVAAGLCGALALGACSGSASVETKTEVSTQTTDENGNTTTTTETTTSNSSTGDSTAATAETADAYNNKFFNLNFALLDGWTFVDVSSAPVNSNFSALSGAGTSVDMFASDGDKTMAMLAITPASEATKGKTAEELLAANTEADIKAMTDAGIKVTVNDADITFGGEAIKAKEYVMSADDGSTSYALMANKVVDDQIATLLIMSDVESKMTDVVSHFSAGTQAAS